MRYNTAMGVWQEQDLKFDATLIKQGENEMKLTVPAGDLTTGVVYDYLRLELDEKRKPARIKRGFVVGGGQSRST